MDQSNHLQTEGGGRGILHLGAVLLRLKGAVVSAILRTFQKILQGFVMFSFIFLLLWIAAFLYGSFYYSYMPLAAYSTPVHYYYRTDCGSTDSFFCSYPVANISLVRNEKHVLTFGQAYQISLQLDMPDSPTNHELGMFMIKTTCFSRDGDQVASSTRSTRPLLSASSSRFSMLRYRSDLLRTITTMLFLPAFLTGITEQKQMLEVELFSDYTDDPYSPSATAVIEVLAKRVQIYSSELYIHAHFTGIRYLLFYFPLLSALVGISSNFIFLSVLLILSYIRLTWRLSPVQTQANGVLPEREDTAENDQRDNQDTGSAEQLGPLHRSSESGIWNGPHGQFGNNTEQ